MYAIYKYTKGFYLVDAPINTSTKELYQSIETQLFAQEKLYFLNTTIYTNPRDVQVAWLNLQM